MTAPFPTLEPQKRRIALLVDGDNVSPARAEEIATHADSRGETVIRRVYGAKPLGSGWRDNGFRTIPTGGGKNATDIVMCIDAVDLSHSAGLDTFVIASSDQDFTHLAHHLRERGFAVIGMGEAAKTPVAFRLACSSFVPLAHDPTPDATPPASAPAPKREAASGLDQTVCAIIRKAGPQGMLITALNAAVQKAEQVKISTLPDKNWRTYLVNRPNLYDCDPRGNDARVRLRTDVKAGS